MRHTILIVDGLWIVRAGLVSLIHNNNGFEVVGEARDGRTALKLVRELKPDIVLTDVSLPKMNGIELSKRISKDLPGIKVIAFSLPIETTLVAEVLDSGVKSYIDKSSGPDEIVQALTMTARGNSCLCPIASRVSRGRLFIHDCSRGIAYSLLSPREREVLQLLAEGRQNKAIAQELGISPKTVETHRYRIMRKLEIFTIAGLTKFAAREGITALR